MLSGIGLGWRREIAADLLARPELVDFVEVVAENVFGKSPLRREVLALSEVWPVIPHGIGLSLGSAEGIDRERARRLGKLARDLRAGVVSEHVALTRAEGRELGHLIAVPFTREAVAVVGRNVAAARRQLPDVPLLLENVAWTLRFSEDEMTEGQFYDEIGSATGCGLLLDVANLFANSRNSGCSPDEALAQFPLERVAMLHVAGGHWEDGFYADTHAHAVPDEVYGLLSEVVRRRGPVPVVLERDAHFPAFDELVCELERIRLLVPRRSEAAGTLQGGLESSGRPAPARCSDLAKSQVRLARALTDPGPANASDAVAFDATGLARTRRVLAKKRRAESREMNEP